MYMTVEGKVPPPRTLSIGFETTMFQMTSQPPTSPLHSFIVHIGLRGSRAAALRKQQSSVGCWEVAAVINMHQASSSSSSSRQRMKTKLNVLFIRYQLRHPQKNVYFWPLLESSTPPSPFRRLRPLFLDVKNNVWRV